MRSETSTKLMISQASQFGDDNIAVGEYPLVAALKGFSRLDAGVVALAGSTVLVGWLVGSHTLMRVLPGFVAMNPLTAVCFIAAGISLTCFWSAETQPSRFKSRLGQLLSGALSLVGTLKLLDYFFGWNSGLDQILFREQLAADHTGIPNRMAPNTAFNFLLSGITLALLNSGRRRSRLAQNLNLVVAFHSLLALLGYVYSANYLYGVGSYIPMAVHTAALFLLLSLGLLSTQTDYGAVGLFVSRTPGGAIARRLLPFAIGVPAVLGALRLWGEKLRIYNSDFGVTIMVLVCIAAFAGLICWNAVLLNRTDDRRRQCKR